MTFVHLRNPQERLLLPYRDTLDLGSILTGFYEKGGELVTIDEPVNDLEITPQTWPERNLGRFLLTTGDRATDSSGDFESVSIRLEPGAKTGGMIVARHDVSNAPGGVVTLQPGEAYAITTPWRRNADLHEVGGLTADLYPEQIEFLGRTMSRGVIYQADGVSYIAPPTPQ